jgi:hypothetical protein
MVRTDPSTKEQACHKKKQQTKMNVKKLEQENKIGYKNP